jgi:hypothetical protein
MICRCPRYGSERERDSHKALGGGVTRSINLDAHGKCLGSCRLDMDFTDD